MSDEDVLLAAVSEDDPCGPDRRCEPEMLSLSSSLARAVRGSEGAVVGAETVTQQTSSFDEIRSEALALSRRTKDVDVLVIYVEASWRQHGLAGFACAMESAVKVMSKWPDPILGVHPRADEEDGDLGERSAALGRLVRQIPSMAATVGWGTDSGNVSREETAVTLTGIFERWTPRLSACFGSELTTPKEAWRALQGLLAGVSVGTGDGETEDGRSTDSGIRTPTPVDVWELIDLTIERMSEQNRHSPALCVLRLVSGWRDLELTEISERMKTSGVTMEQLMDSVRKQTKGL